MKGMQTSWTLLGISLWLVFSSLANAHCDTMDGPVIKDAQVALTSGDVSGVLKWIPPKDEQQIAHLFQQVTKARSQGEPARTLTEKYFFETLVRLHRVSEGAPFTGLKPAGNVEPIIAKADLALNQGNVERLSEMITRHISKGIQQRFQQAVETQKHHSDSVEAGRAYVRAYVEYTHYLEGLHAAAVGISHDHDFSVSEAEEHKGEKQ